MQKTQLPLILCLMGPTASGKTALAVELTQRFPCEIISVDSAMVYRGLNIGTAKPEPAILKIAPHRLLDLRDPAESYSAADFKIDAEREIKAILAKDKIPLLVGGTMLYFHLLQQGLDELPEQNEALRVQLQAEADLKGWPELHKRLATVDPEASARIHPHDGQRIQRALEVYTLTGRALSSQQLRHQGEEKNTRIYDFQNLIISPSDRTNLHRDIERRFLKMLELGFMAEVEKLYARPELSLQKPAIRSVGYRQAWEYLSGQLTFEEMKEKAIIATRQLAKRQLTWLRSFEEALWFASENPDLLAKIEAAIQKSLARKEP